MMCLMCAVLVAVSYSLLSEKISDTQHDVCMRVVMLLLLSVLVHYIYPIQSIQYTQICFRYSIQIVFGVLN